MLAGYLFHTLYCTLVSPQDLFSSLVLF